jgi:hypothetical protein
MPISLFEIPAEFRREENEPIWIVEKTTLDGKRIQYRVKGKTQAAAYAGAIGGILLGPEENLNAER